MRPCRASLSSTYRSYGQIAKVMVDTLHRIPTPVVYSLKGMIGGSEKTFHLKAGKNDVGSLETNDIVLPRRGVSRNHAVVVVEHGELHIEDLGSKNGTFVNGLRVQQTRIGIGEEVRFGPVALRFEELHHEDTELAITFEPPISDQTGTIPIFSPAFRRSTSQQSGELSRHWLRIAEAFHARLFYKPEGDIGAALRMLTEELHLKSACALEVPDNTDPIVLAASGQITKDATSKLKELYQKQQQEKQGEPGLFFHTAADGKGPDTTFAALVVPDMDPLVLALWGGFPGRAQSELLLRLLVRLIDPCRPRVDRSGNPEGPSNYPGLVVPRDYVYAQSEVMGRIYGLMQNLAQGDLPILVIGETGVGKEYLAQILHLSSPRRQGPFIAINCAAIPAELLESELFGIGEGVATGVTGSKGRILQANGGTLFLDEIGDMSADLQAKLLRALQEKEVHPVGREPVSIDVRVLAATNQELTRRIESGQFRADLYYRLAGYVLEIPPLRERPEDVPALVEFFLRDCARELGRSIRGITVRALRLLTEYPWPGNVRELANEVRRAVYLCADDGTVQANSMSKTILDFHRARGSLERPLEADAQPAETPSSAGDPLDLPAPWSLGLDSLDLAQLEKMAIEEALRRCRKNQVQAAKLLGISRQSLRRRMERFGYLGGGDD